MKNNRQDQKAGTAREGSSKQKGKSVNPADLPDTDAPASPAKQKRYIPIGRPVSPQRYKKIKKEIGEGTPLPKGKGQEDPST
jgi:hypothetical protein